jgi:hypothetical protein
MLNGRFNRFIPGYLRFKLAGFGNLFAAEYTFCPYVFAVTRAAILRAAGSTI